MEPRRTDWDYGRHQTGQAGSAIVWAERSGAILPFAKIRKGGVMLKRGLVAVMILAVAAAGCRRIHEAVPVYAVPAEVPEPFQMTYRELDAELQRQLPLIRLPSAPKAGRTAFGTELPVAGSHRAGALLNEGAWETIAIALERLKTLGVRCVALGLSYPVLTRDHARTPEYRSFYRRLADEIRRRGLTIVVAMGSAPRDSELGRTGADVRGPSRGRFNAGLREMAEAVLSDIRPSYLTLLSEPDTQTRNTGLAFSPSEFAATVKLVARGLDRAGARLGAGAGTWAAQDYFKALAAIPELDYLDLHIYPIQYGFAAERALKAAEVARSNGKRVAIGGAWLCKVWGRETSRIAPVEAFSRDVFSFWQPLDGHFIELVVDLAQRIDAEFCSFSGTKYLYGYLDYDAETGRLSSEELIRLSDRMAEENIRKGALGPTGEKLRRMIKP